MSELITRSRLKTMMRDGERLGYSKEDVFKGVLAVGNRIEGYNPESNNDGSSSLLGAEVSGRLVGQGIVSSLAGLASTTPLGALTTGLLTQPTEEEAPTGALAGLQASTQLAQPQTKEEAIETMRGKDFATEEEAQIALAEAEKLPSKSTEVIAGVETAPEEILPPETVTAQAESALQFGEQTQQIAQKVEQGEELTEQEQQLASQVESLEKEAQQATPEAIRTAITQDKHEQLTDRQFKAIYDRERNIKEKTQRATELFTQKEGRLPGVVRGLETGFESAANKLGEGVSKLGVKPGEEQEPSRVAEGFLDVGLGLTEALYAPLGGVLGAAEPEIQKGIQASVNAYNALPEEAKGFLEENASKMAEIAKDNPILAKSAQLALEIVPIAKGAKITKQATNKINNLAESLRKVVPEQVASAKQFASTKLPELKEFIAMKAKPLGAINATAVAGAVKKAVEVTAPVAKAVGKVAISPITIPIKIAGGVRKYAVTQLSGLDVATRKIAKRFPKLLDDFQKGVDNSEKLANDVLEKINKKSRDISYTGKGYESIRKIKKDVNIPIEDINKSLTKKGLKLENGKLVEIDKLSTNLNSADLTAINKAYDLISGRKTLTSNQVLNLRQKLDDLAKFEKGGFKVNKGEKIIRGIRRDVDEIAKREIKGLRGLDEKFAKDIKEVNRLKKEYLTKEGGLKDTAISAIANATREGRQLKLSRLEKLSPKIKNRIQALVASKDIQNALQSKVGTYTKALLTGGVGAGAITGGISTTGAIAGVVALALFNPKTVIGVLKFVGRTKQFVKKTIKKIINKVRKGKQLSNSEAKTVNKAMVMAVKDSKDIRNEIKRLSPAPETKLLPKGRE